MNFTTILRHFAVSMNLFASLILCSVFMRCKFSVSKSGGVVCLFFRSVSDVHVEHHVPVMRTTITLAAAMGPRA